MSFYDKFVSGTDGQSSTLNEIMERISRNKKVKEDEKVRSLVVRVIYVYNFFNPEASRPLYYGPGNKDI